MRPALQAKLVAHMERTADPMLAAFQDRNDRTKVDKILIATYGPKKDERPRTGKGKSRKKKKQDK